MIYIKYTDELIDSVNKYNDNLESISQRILNLKIDFTDEDIQKLSDLIDAICDASKIINNSDEARAELKEAKAELKEIKSAKAE